MPRCHIGELLPFIYPCHNDYHDYRDDYHGYHGDYHDVDLTYVSMCVRGHDYRDDYHGYMVITMITMITMITTMITMM